MTVHTRNNKMLSYRRETALQGVEVCGSTRTRGYGSGIPVFTRKEHHFSRCRSYIECFFYFFFF